MGKKNPLIPKVRRVAAPVHPNHASLGHPSNVARIDVPGGTGTNIQFHGNPGKFSINDHRITRVRPVFSPVED